MIFRRDNITGISCTVILLNYLNRRLGSYGTNRILAANAESSIYTVA